MKSERISAQGSPQRQAPWIDVSRLPVVRPPLNLFDKVLYSSAERGNRQQWVGVVTSGSADFDASASVTVQRVLSSRVKNRTQSPLTVGREESFTQSDGRTSRLHRLRPEEYKVLIAGDYSRFRRLQNLRPR